MIIVVSFLGTFATLWGALIKISLSVCVYAGDNSRTSE
jgi:hypothetical protein